MVDVQANGQKLMQIFLKKKMKADDSCHLFLAQKSCHQLLIV